MKTFKEFLSEGRMTFCTSCVNSTAPAINDMVDEEKTISWRTFLKYVNKESVYTLLDEFGYKTPNNPSGFMHIKDDYAVSFHKSKYRGKPCVYIDHSSIEYIFT